MRLFGLIGYPLSHSFSAKYFSEKFEREGLLDCRYELFPIASIAELPLLIKTHPDLCGLNVTIPYKEQVLPFLQESNALVQQIKACNCIRIEAGRWTGFNTDAIGFEYSLTKGWSNQHRKALILGTGGAAKAVQFVLAKLGIDYKYVSRKPSVNNYSYEQVSPAVIAAHTLVINTTPLGTYPNTAEAAPIPYEALTSSHYLFDMVYNPEKTLFLKKGEEYGAMIRNGYEMLVQQAEASWRIWEGGHAPIRSNQ